MPAESEEGHFAMTQCLAVPGAETAAVKNVRSGAGNARDNVHRQKKTRKKQETQEPTGKEDLGCWTGELIWRRKAAGCVCLYI